MALHRRRPAAHHLCQDGTGSPGTRGDEADAEGILSVRVHIPGPLRPFTDGRRHLHVESPGTVGELLRRLPVGVQERVLDEEGRVRRHVNVFVGQTSIRETGQLETPVGDGGEVFIVPAVSGGLGS